MAIRPSPMHYRCSACNWGKTVAPRSDALGPGDFYRAYPQCGHQPLDVQPVGAATVLGDLVESAR